MSVRISVKLEYVCVKDLFIVLFFLFLVTTRLGEGTAELVCVCVCARFDLNNILDGIKFGFAILLFRRQESLQKCGFSLIRRKMENINFI